MCKSKCNVSLNVYTLQKYYSNKKKRLHKIIDGKMRRNGSNAFAEFTCPIVHQHTCFNFSFNSFHMIAFHSIH